MAFKFKKVYPPVKVDVSPFPSLQSDSEDDALTGVVQDKTASAPEERLAKALDRAHLQYYFRFDFGAPKGLPGWKEIDFVVFTKGLIYLQEVDTAFTHRSKENKDVLHDALALNDREINSLGTVFPKVFHVDGESELPTRDHARQYVADLYGKG